MVLFWALVVWLTITIKNLLLTLSMNTVTLVVSISSVLAVLNWKKKNSSKKVWKSSVNWVSKLWLSSVVTTLIQMHVYWLNTMLLRTMVFR